MIQNGAPATCKFDVGIDSRTMGHPPGRSWILTLPAENSAKNN